MNKNTIKRILKWSSIAFLTLVLIVSLKPLEGKDENTGRRLFFWSGWSSLFNENDFGLKFNYYPKVNLNGLDGPYIVDKKVFYVDHQNELVSSLIENSDSLLVKVNNKDKNNFYFSLQEKHSLENSNYSLPQKLIAISDIEGNFNAFSSFLISNGVIDKDFNWIFNNGHLVLVGDFVDRGENVTQVLWLIYKLEQQARLQEGKVHFILGNHEILNFQGNPGYNKEKYIKVAQNISKYEEWEKAVSFMFSDNTELGKWIKTKNVVEKIGDYVFVHGGLSTDLLRYNLDIREINNISRKNWDDNLYTFPGDDEIANTLIGRKSPIWYRGLVTSYKDYYKRIEEDELNNLLKYYSAKKVIVGHTIVSDVFSSFNGKVICIDVKHGKSKNSGLTKGLLIEDGKEYIINDNGEKKILH